MRRSRATVTSDVSQQLTWIVPKPLFDYGRKVMELQVSGSSNRPSQIIGSPVVKSEKRCHMRSPLGRRTPGLSARSQLRMHFTASAGLPLCALGSCPERSEQKIWYRNRSRSRMRHPLARCADDPNSRAPRKMPSSSGILNRGSLLTESGSVTEMSWIP